MGRKETWKNADYPNAIPKWRKHPTTITAKEKRRAQVKRVLASLDWEKLSTIGKERKETQ